MAQVTIRQFLNDFDRVIQQTQGNMAIKLAKGQIADMAEYNRAVGRSEGLGQAVLAAREMLSQMEAAEQQGDLPEMPATAAGGKRGKKK